MVLVHSQTPDGRFCAEWLQAYAERKGLHVEIRQVNELSDADAETFNRGLSRLVRVLAEAIRVTLAIIQRYLRLLTSAATTG
ncbi:hypothetical protein [Roseiflexus sp.]|uniref:hypothetical protein n=1 Tax=Roseiflexus sp. TaxID=2562120 RepID=UPI00398B3CE8